MIWVTGHEVRGPILVGGAVLCVICAGMIEVWPRLTGSKSPESQHLGALKEQTEELRRAREHQEYLADPAIRAFSEARARDIQSGIETQDTQLGILILLLVTQTAWGRWQAVQHQVSFPVQPPVTNHNRLLIRIAESHLLHQLDQGILAARGFNNGNTNDVRFISPDWWGRVYIEVVHDDRQIFKASIKPRENVDPEVCGRFTSISCELPKFFALFPQYDDGPRSFEPEVS
jgi:hypothetical protein